MPLEKNRFHYAPPSYIIVRCTFLFKENEILDIVKQNCITTFGGSVGKSAWSAYRAQGMMKIAVLDADLIARKQHRFPNLVCMETIWLS